MIIIEWDERNREHFREHSRCTPAQVEDVLLARCHGPRRRQRKGPPGQQRRFRYEGQPCGGRFLVVIAAVRASGLVLRPTTCWPLVGVDRMRYLSWRKTARLR